MINRGVDNCVEKKRCKKMGKNGTKWSQFYNFASK